MSKSQKQIEGAQFLQWFGPLLDALRALGGSGTPDEVVDKIAATLKVPDEQLNETLPSGELRFRNQVAWARWFAKDCLTPRVGAYGASQKQADQPPFQLTMQEAYF